MSIDVSALSEPERLGLIRAIEAGRIRDTGHPALMAAYLEHCRRNGLAVVIVPADAEDSPEGTREGTESRQQGADAVHGPK